MIGKLTGLVDEQGDDHLLLDVGGVGYLVFCSARTLAALPRRGQQTVVLIETHVREDHIHLYGFAEALERDWFRLLSSVQGVGSRMALAILSVLAPLDLAQAIVAQDKAALTSANGVGPKLAARIVGELKDRAARYAFAPVSSGAPAAAGAGGGAAPSALSGAAEDAVSALVNLGYRRTEAFVAVGQAARRLGGDAPLEELIRGGLKELSS